MKRLLLTFVFCFYAAFFFASDLLAVDLVEKDNLKLDLYGEIYADFFYNNASGAFLEDGGGLFFRNESGHGFGSQALMGSSLLGLDLSFGKAEAVFELGINEIVRKAFIKYNFNSDNEHYLMLGKDTILSFYNFGQVSNDLNALIDFGALGDYRSVALRYGIKGFHLGIVMPYAGDWYQDPFYDVVDELNEAVGGEVLNAFKAIPGVEVAYTFANDLVDLKAFASYKPYYLGYGEGDTLLIHSANVGFGSDFMLGDGILHFTVWYGLNQNLAGGLSHTVGDVFTLKNGKLENNLQHAFGGALGFEYTIADFVTPGIGVGYTGALSANDTDLRHYVGFYVNCKFDIGKYFSLIPEIAFQTAISGNEDEKGNLITAGLLGQVLF